MEVTTRSLSGYGGDGISVRFSCGGLECGGVSHRCAVSRDLVRAELQYMGAYHRYCAHTVEEWEKGGDFEEVVRGNRKLPTVGDFVSLQVRRDSGSESSTLVGSSTGVVGGSTGCFPSGECVANEGCIGGSCGGNEKGVDVHVYDGVEHERLRSGFCDGKVGGDQRFGKCQCVGVCRCSSVGIEKVVEELRLPDDGVNQLGRGKHYWKNKVKREKRKGLLREKDGFCKERASAPTVCTVDTRTAVEIEAVQTLAARRVAENKVAVALAGHKLRALRDKSRTDMVDRLAAARGEQRINQAKAKSQKSFKECDESMKSLGSSGSAGEFALKQEVKKAKDNEKIRQYVEKQAQLLLKYASPDVRQMVAEIPAPVLEDEFEVFGDCPSDYDEDERQAYYDDLNIRNEQNFDRCATYC